MQHKIIPIMGMGSIDSMTGDFGSLESGMSTAFDAKPTIDKDSIGAAFLYLLLVQGFFSGLAIGKLSEGNIKSGLKHSFLLIVFSFLIYSGVNSVLN